MRKKKQTYLKLITGALIVGLAGSALAQLDDLRVDLNLKDADIVAAARALTVKTGVKFVFAPSSTPYGKITLKLDQVTPDEAIKYICTAAGAIFRKDDNGVFLISRTAMQGGNSTPDSGQTDTALAPKKARSVVKKFQMRSADAYDVITQLYGVAPDSNRVWRGMSNLNNSFGSQSSDLWRGHGPIGDRGNPTPTVAAPAVISNSAVPQYSSEGAKDIQLPGESANQFGAEGSQFGGGQGGFGGGQGGFGGGQGGFGGGQGGFGGGQGLGGGLGQGLGNGRGLIPQSIDFMTYDPNDNAILVRGTEEDIAELQKNIALFDVAPKQVLIKLEFITTSASITKSIGYDFNYERGPILFGAPPGTFARSSDPFFLSYSIGNVAMRLRASLNESNGKVVSAPIIRTLNNQYAHLSSTVTTNVVQANTTQTTSGLVTSFTITQVPYSTGIDVSPRINLDGTITMYLEPQVSDEGQIKNLPTGDGGATQEVADRLTQEVRVVVRVKNGQTIVLGGLTRRTDQGTQSKYPILGDLPIIGQFFRGKQSSKQYSELLIFVTPTVVEDDEFTGIEP